MNYEVSLLRVHGRRLRPGETPQKASGRLTIEVEEPKHSKALPKRAATLWVLERSGGDHRRGVLDPLFDPRIVSLDEDGVLTLAGIELQASDGSIAEHSQVWRCRPLNGRKAPRDQPAAVHSTEASEIA